MKKTELRKTLQKIHWAVPLFGIALLILSPVLMPIIVVMANPADVSSYFKQCFEAIKYNPWKNKE